MKGGRIHGLLTLYFAKGALANFLDDGVLAELGWGVDHLVFRGDGHGEQGRGDVGKRELEERNYKQIALPRGCK